MRIGKIIKVTTEPRPIKLPQVEPERLPTREPTKVPIKTGKSYLVDVLRGSYTPNDYMELGSLPSRCPKCGGELEESGILNFILECPKHGVIWAEGR